MNALLTLVLWALVLTIGLQYLNNYLGSPRSSATSHEIMYTELKDLIREGEIEKITIKDGMLTAYPKEGYAYTDEDGKTYTDNYTLFTMDVGDPQFYELVDQYDVDLTRPYVPEMPVILELLVGYLLPVVVMVLAFSLLFRFMAKKGGGFGGLGSVGTRLEVCHDAPTPIGMEVWAEAEITAVSENGKMVDFAVRAWDERGPIGSGVHTRAIIKNEKFLAKCNAKLEG